MDMETYTRALRHYLTYESEHYKKGGVYEYTQRGLTYNYCKMDGCKMPEEHIGLLFEIMQAESGPVSDIMMIMHQFSAVRYAIREAMSEYPGVYTQDIRNIHWRLYDCEPVIEIKGELEFVTRRTPADMLEIAEYHADWIRYGGDRRTGLIVAFFQCINAHLSPFILHAENLDEYTARLDDPERLEALFRIEQREFYRETESMVIDQV